MAIMRGEPLVAKLAVFAKYGVLPGAMIAALIYSPPNYAQNKSDEKSLPKPGTVLDRLLTPDKSPK